MEIGKTDESLRRKATGPVKWQPVAWNEMRCLFGSVFITRGIAEMMEITQQQYTATGMNAHIAKPIDIKTILAVFDLVFGTS